MEVRRKEGESGGKEGCNELMNKAIKEGRSEQRKMYAMTELTNEGRKGINKGGRKEVCKVQVIPAETSRAQPLSAD